MSRRRAYDGGLVTRVFSQQSDLVASLPKILAHARRFFAADLEVLSASPPARPDVSVAEVRVRLSSARYAGSGTFLLEARPRTDDDQFAAEAAEACGKATNMALLAARCPSVWRITPERDVSGSAEPARAAPEV